MKFPILKFILSTLLVHKREIELIKDIITVTMMRKKGK
jgi:hypothetical protein